MAEEKKWLHLTMAIIVAFAVSVFPVFVFYILSIFGIKMHPVFQLAVWWLLISGKYCHEKECFAAW